MQQASEQENKNCKEQQKGEASQGGGKDQKDQGEVGPTHQLRVAHAGANPNQHGQCKDDGYAGAQWHPDLPDGLAMVPGQGIVGKGGSSDSRLLAGSWGWNWCAHSVILT